MTEPGLKLPRNADQLLRELPVGEPDFEAQAKTIEARLMGSPGGVVFDDLLQVPELTAEPGELTWSSARATPGPKNNFADLARRSVQQKGHASELTKDLLAASAQSRRPNAEMIERVRAAARPTAASTPLPSTPLPATRPTADEQDRASGVVARTATTVRPAAKPAVSRGTVIGIASSLLGLAAVVALVLKSGSDQEARTRAVLAAQKNADAPAAATPRNAPAKAAPTPAKEDERILSPEALAPAPAAGTDAAKPRALVPTASPAAKAAPSPTAVAATNGQAKPIAVVLEDDPEPAKPAEAAPQAAPVPEPQLKPAEGSTASVPLNPSAGALSTALGTVRGNAQACLAGQTEAVTAVVVFAADGHVLRVSAGGPSGACIQAALSQAHVAPFAKESFSTTTTIRPP